MNCSTKNAGVSKNVSGFVLPLGSTVNMDGTALFECAGVLFISQILGVNLDLSFSGILISPSIVTVFNLRGIKMISSNCNF